MDKHVTAVAIMHIGLSIIGLVVGAFLFSLFGFLSTLPDESEGRVILGILALFLGGGFIVTSSLGLVGGIGLLKYANWARILVLIISAINLVNIPFGTALGVYSIWVLVQDETIKLFAGARLMPAPAV